MSFTPIDMFTRTSDAVIQFNARFNTMRDDQLDIHALQSHLSALEKLWTQAQDKFEKCCDYMMSSVETTKEVIDAVDQKYNSSFQIYVDCQSAINRKLGQFKKYRTSSINGSLCGSVASLIETPGETSAKSPIQNSQAIGNNLSTSTHASRENHSQIQTPLSSIVRNNSASFRTTEEVSHLDCVHNLALPPCDTDIFEGDFHSWPTFRDLFTAIYIVNGRLTDVEKLCHLVRKTSGEAREIVSKFPLINRSFELAWKALVETYDNPRLLVHNQLKVLFDIPVLYSETSSGLKSIQCGINGCLSSMSVYDVNTENWDPILVFLCLQRLPKITQTLWEQSVKDKSSLSSWKDLDAFLTERIRTLMCLHDMRATDQSKRSNNSKVQAHHSNIRIPEPPRSPRASKGSNCLICQNQRHKLYDCPRFKSFTPADRYKVMKRHHLCINCLRNDHEVKNCDSKRRCSKCNKSHHTLLHRDDITSSNSNRTSTVTSNAPRNSSATPSTVPPNSENCAPGTSAGCLPRQVFHAAQNKAVLLGTAMVNIVHLGVSFPARALIDPASESSFISERLQTRLKLPARSTNAVISGVSCSLSATANKACRLQISSPFDPSLKLETNVLVLRAISGNLPSFVVNSDLRSQIPDLRLADVNLFESRPVDLLLGADLYPKILLDGCRPILSGALLAQNTVFGWLVTGPVPATQVRTFATTVDVAEEDKIQQTLLRFWEIEEPPKRKILSPSDRFCEENYVRTTRRDSEGRYIVTLPLKSEISAIGYLGESRANVLKQYYRNESSLLKKPELKLVYDQVLSEYLELDHMRPVPVNTSMDVLSCYLPHHPVINLAKQTTKLRVVFNASNKTSNGQSLNDILHIGPTLQQDLVLLILRWRIFKFVFNSDITQMYRQVRVDSKHSPLQRILYRNSTTKQVLDYELQTVTFGVNCAPYLAIRTLLQLADDTESEFPLAAHILRKCMYVDDVLAGAHDIETALAARDQLIRALSSAKFELRKWTANNRAILDCFPPEHLVDAQLLSFVEASSSKPLGIRWNARLDCFFFEVSPIVNKHFTKREVLSAIAKLFDPVGWLAPVIVRAKMIMQKIWLDNIGWDDQLLAATEAEWRSFVETYPHVNSIRIPRWVQYVPGFSVELHVFSDASEKAYAGMTMVSCE
ncbi:uncharacterized protein LOC131806656 [Musca domestica]|uniref:Uncharacterized protein LOC131806656 n=1 Tax=Musca domestica TaxID=7370 RepID=A0ABM3VN11_MUSDO|nr:uncharacterized protein LOC131806656 [Musca domestica]